MISWRTWRPRTAVSVLTVTETMWSRRRLTYLVSGEALAIGGAKNTESNSASARPPRFIETGETIRASVAAVELSSSSHLLNSRA